MIKDTIIESLLAAAREVLQLLVAFGAWGCFAYVYCSVLLLLCCVDSWELLFGLLLLLCHLFGCYWDWLIIALLLLCCCTINRYCCACFLSWAFSFLRNPIDFPAFGSNCLFFFGLFQLVRLCHREKLFQSFLLSCYDGLSSV
ncbi:hypothetical protein OWV82_012018 [Melia azedarach]|uniref:Uncharacterized protein n=1 Tax=Melia azedarach TaxID=155640 RepID=A0ACC1Y1Q0_MELAZ|nr:hypothetical protein OWV82_012018 [Melia azedarach]